MLWSCCGLTLVRHQSHIIYLFIWEMGKVGIMWIIYNESKQMKDECWYNGMAKGNLMLQVITFRLLILDYSLPSDCARLSS